MLENWQMFLKQVLGDKYKPAAGERKDKEKKVTAAPTSAL